ncbi:MAG: PilZ domain-containing protein [Terriglobales bacterium]
MILAGMDQPYQPERTINSRRYPRYELETELKAAIYAMDRPGMEHREMRGRSLNINEGGMGGIFVSGWDVGTSVALQFSVPIATNPIKVKGVVRNRTGYRYGFEFTDLTPEERETITRTCRTLDLLQ